jgi:hypothetical protein
MVYEMYYSNTSSLSEKGRNHSILTRSEVPEHFIHETVFMYRITWAKLEQIGLHISKARKTLGRLVPQKSVHVKFADMTCTSAIHCCASMYSCLELTFIKIDYNSSFTTAFDTIFE